MNQDTFVWTAGEDADATGEKQTVAAIELLLRREVDLNEYAVAFGPRNGKFSIVFEKGAARNLGVPAKLCSSEPFGLVTQLARVLSEAMNLDEEKERPLKCSETKELLGAYAKIGCSLEGLPFCITREERFYRVVFGPSTRKKIGSESVIGVSLDHICELVALGQEPREVSKQDFTPGGHLASVSP